MSFKYELPPGYELTPIPTDAERKKECRRLVGLLDEYKETVERIDGLVGYGIGISKDNWCKICVQLTFSHKVTQQGMFDAAVVLINIPGMHFEAKRERRPGGESFSGQRIRPDKPR